MALFDSRLAAAEELARHVSYLRPQQPVVVGLANGGVPVAETIARSLDAPMDVMLLEHLRDPRGGGRVVAALDEFGRICMIEQSARWHHLASQEMIAPAREVFRRLQRKRERIREVFPLVLLADRTVLIVDHGVDTAARMLGAVASARDRGARKVVVAAPAGPSDATWSLHETADEVIIPHRPAHFQGIPKLYNNYMEVSDDLVLAILGKWAATHPSRQPVVRTLTLKLDGGPGHTISCEMDLPPGTTRGSGPFPAVIFAHGFESNARSSRNVTISRRLANRGIIGVRFDFTGHGRSEGKTEDATARRMLEDLALVHRSMVNLQEVDEQRVGLNGSGTGGMVVLRYAAEHPEIRGLVIRGPVCGDETEAAHHVKTPTLIIHAERDTALSESAEMINRELASTHEFLRIPDANRLFSDPISLELMIDASVGWLADHVRR